MNKDDLLTLLVYAVMMVAAIFVGIQIIGGTDGALDSLGLMQTNQRVLFTVASIAIGAVLNIFVFETGHIIGARIGKYQIISANFAGICFYRANEKKWKVRFQNFDGLTGETKIMPKSAKSNPKPYIWGPIILFIIEFVILIFGLYSFLPDDSYIKQGSIIVASVGAMLAIYDIMPFKLDTLNDGYRLVLVSKPVNTEAYNEMMRIQGLNYQGKEVGEIREFDTITSVTSAVNLLKIYDYEDKADLVNAERLTDKIIAAKDNVSPQIYGRAAAQKLYVLLKKGLFEDAEKYWIGLDNTVRRLIGSDWELETIRVYFLYSGLVSKSSTECAYAINRRPRAVKRLETKARLEKENVLFEDALKEVKAANPEWQFEIK